MSIGGFTSSHSPNDNSKSTSVCASITLPVSTYSGHPICTYGAINITYTQYIATLKSSVC